MTMDEYQHQWRIEVSGQGVSLTPKSTEGQTMYLIVYPLGTLEDQGTREKIQEECAKLADDACIVATQSDLVNSVRTYRLDGVRIRDIQWGEESVNETISLGWHMGPKEDG